MDQLPGHLLKVSISCETEDGGSKSDIIRCVKFYGTINCKFKKLFKEIRQGYAK